MADRGCNIQGVWSADVDDPFAQAVAAVTAADLQRALSEHFGRFLVPVHPLHGYAAAPTADESAHSGTGCMHTCGRGRVTVVAANAKRTDALVAAFRAGPTPLPMVVHDVLRRPPRGRA
jgi:hypothetical protein